MASGEKRADLALSAVTLLFGPLRILWEGYVLAKLWAWHVALPFGLPSLTVLHAVGIGMVTAVLTHQLPSKSDYSAEELFGREVARMMMAAFALLIGWVVS